MRFRQGQYQQQVLTQEQMKDYHLNQVIAARNDQYQREQEAKARMEQQRRAAMTEDRARSLERQIEEKRQMQSMAQGQY